MNRRDFLPLLATAPLSLVDKLRNARNRAVRSRVESPKGKEQRLSMVKVSVSGNPPPPPLQTLSLPATLPGFSVTSITVSGGQVTLSWQGGTAPYQIEEETPSGFSKKTYPATMLNSQTIPTDGPSATYRVQSSRGLSAIDSVGGQPRYMFEAPLI